MITIMYSYHWISMNSFLISWHEIKIIKFFFPCTEHVPATFFGFGKHCSNKNQYYCYVFFWSFYMLISWLVCSLYVLMNIVKSISFLCIRTIYESLLIYSSFLYMLVNLHVAQFCLRSQHSLLNALTYSHLINLSTEKNITLFFFIRHQLQDRTHWVK